MSDTIFSPGPTSNTVRTPDGNILTAPQGWVLLPPGDAALTRRVKEAGDHWVVQERKGRKTFSKGVWAPAETIDRIRAGLEVERSTESYAKRKDADARRRDKAQTEYVEDFTGAVLNFLAFHPDHAELAPSRPGCGRSCHTRRQRDCGANETHPRPATCRSRGDCLDAAQDDRLRLDADPQGERQTPRSPANVRPAIEGIARAISSGRIGYRSLSAENRGTENQGLSREPQGVGSFTSRYGSRMQIQVPRTSRPDHRKAGPSAFRCSAWDVWLAFAVFGTISLGQGWHRILFWSVPLSEAVAVKPDARDG